MLIAPLSAARSSAPGEGAASAPSTSGATASVVVESSGVVRLKERKVFALSHEHAGVAATERARGATQALERAFDAKEDETHIEATAHGATIFVGKRAIVELDADDAAAAGSASLDAFAADVSTKVRAALVQEHKRSAIANTVFSFALVVFTGLIAFLLLGKARELAARAHDWVEENPERVPSLRVGGIELLRASVVESVLTIAIDVGKRVVQLGALYAWALLSFSLFEATKSLTERLTGLVLGPLSTALTRVGSALPLVVAAAIALSAVVLAVRFTGMFFRGVVRGDTTLDWVPQELAAPVGVLVRIGIVVGGLVLSAPVLTGGDEGLLSHLGLATLMAFGVAATPVLACVVVGTIVVFGRRLRAGEFIELAGRTGRVRDVTLLDVTVEDEAGATVRLPHLLGLLHPTRVLGAAAVISAEIVVSATASQVAVRALLLDVAAKAGAAPRVDLLSIDVDGALYRVTLGVAPEHAPVGPPVRRNRSTGRSTVVPERRVPSSVESVAAPQLLVLLADALVERGIALGRRSNGSTHEIRVSR